MYRREKKGNFIIWIYIVVWILFFIFFSRIHPSTIFSTDDWIYASYARNAVPLWSAWNPSRVFPETFMGICSYLGVFIIYPFMGDYLQALSLSYALIVSLFCTLYLFCIDRYIMSVFKLKSRIRICEIALYFLLHFWILRIGTSGNQHMFFAANLTCIFFYLLPGLMNAVIVLIMLGYSAGKRDKIKVSGLLWLLLYLSIFSNLFQSIIVSSYLFFDIIFELFISGRKRVSSRISIKAFVSRFRYHLAGLCFWIVSLCFEYVGGRAHSIGSNIDLKNALLNISKLRLNKLFLITFALFIIITFGNYFFKKEKSFYDRMFVVSLGKILCCLFITTVYLILLCAKTDPSYLQRSEVLFGPLFFLILIFINCLSYIIKQKEHKFYIYAAIPVFLYIVLMNTVTGTRTFLNPNSGNMDSRDCNEISGRLVDEIILSAKQHKNNVTIYVPDMGQADNNWPFMENHGSSISHTLYSHGIITYEIDVQTEIDRKHDYFDSDYLSLMSVNPH